MIFLYNKKTKLVKMTCNKLPVYDKSKMGFITMSNPDQQKLDKNYILKVNNSKLVYEKPESIEIKERKDKIKEDLTKATSLDEVKKIIKKLINL